MAKNGIFTSVPKHRPKRNLFDLSHELKTSGKFGYLYPILLMDTLPGDVVRDQITTFLRTAPMLAPIMHQLYVTAHAFFVPNRILSDSWESFITGGQDGLAAPVMPYVTPEGVELADPGSMGIGTLWDHLGLPPLTGAPPADWAEQQLSVLPFRAYAKIFNDYYRDPNLSTELDLETELEGDVSAASAALYTLRQRGWPRDPFTSALPWAQRGASVLLPLAGTGTVTYDAISNWYQADGGDPSAGTPAFAVPNFLQDDTAESLRVENIDQVILDTSNITINDFRRAMALQKWMENQARGGGRYIETIDSQFDVTVPDFRLQRAEYLGGGRQFVEISEVLSHTQGEGDDERVELGGMAGKGISVGKTNRFTYRCQEHGWVMVILSVMPSAGYGQGIEKMWTRADKFDYGWPLLANLGEQPILSKEIFYGYAEASEVGNNTIFGYTPRYAEYKYRNNRIAGDFRETLGFWHLIRRFLSRPVLDVNFTTMLENPDPDTLEESFRRVFANQDGTDYLWIQLHHKLTAKRPLPYFGVPSL